MVDPTWLVRGGAATTVALLSRVDAFEQMDDEQLLDVIADGDRLAGWVQEKQARAIRVLDSRRDRTEHTIDEVAVSLRITRRAAQIRIELAFALETWPMLAAAMAAGRIDARKATEIAGAVQDLKVPDVVDGEPDPELVTRLVDEAITYAEEHTPTELAAWLRRRVVTTDPAAAEDRRARKLAKRELSLYPLADGMAYLTAYGSAHLLSAVLNTAHACALALPADDERTLAQATLDAFVELVRHGAAAGEIPGALGRRAQIVLTPDPVGGSVEPPAVVELAGVGAVPGSLLEDAARDCEVRFEHVPVSATEATKASGECPSGCMPDPGYEPSTATRRAVTFVRRRCVFPGCRAPATCCDLDHVIPWPAGPTCVHNLAPVCRRHHELKTKRVWDLRREAGGVLVWTSPAGRRYVVENERAQPPDPDERRLEPCRHLQLLDPEPFEEPPEYQWYDWDPEFDDPFDDVSAPTGIAA